MTNFSVFDEPNEPGLPPPKAQRMGYVVHVTLDRVKPPIWRRLLVASDLNLSQLHMVLQTAMGWTLSHLHGFEVWSVQQHRFVDSGLLSWHDVEQDGRSGPCEADVQLSQVLTKAGEKMLYLYDFGNNWAHRVRLEKTVNWVNGAPLARCLAGKRACPPEDCGGPSGFALFLRQAAQNHKGGTDAPEDSEWGWEFDQFDPEEFDMAQVNQNLAAEEQDGFEEGMAW